MTEVRDDGNNRLPDEIITREAPQLVTLLKEMKDGLDAVRCKVQALTLKVKENQYPTADGMSYLDAKHLLLLSYCQSIVYYLIRKAKGLSVEGHPVVRSLVEIRLFLEKIRPIDKKLEYQVQKLIRAAAGVDPEKMVALNGKNKDGTRDEEDPSTYRPNPDMLVSRISMDYEDGRDVYRIPKIAPTTMDEDRISKQDRVSKQEKQALRREKELLRRTKQSPYLKDIMDELQDRPEEVGEIIGDESREFSRYKAKWEEQAKQEEDLFTRAPVTKKDKKLEKYMKKSRDGLHGLGDGFYDEIRSLPLDEEENENMTSYTNSGSKGGKGYKKRKRKH